MGEEQRGTWQEMLAASEEAYESGTDLTLAVEEEFALLDPDGLGLVNRFEAIKAASIGTEVEPHLVGELIASEVEVRTGRCTGFGEAAATMPNASGKIDGTTVTSASGSRWRRWRCSSGPVKSVRGGASASSVAR